MLKGLTWMAAGASLWMACEPALAQGSRSAPERPRTGLVVLDELRAPGLEVELSGIYPHPTQDHLYFVAANRTPVYRAGQRPMLPARYRGKLLTVDGRSGAVVRAFDLVGGDYGDLASDGRHLYVVSLRPPEILKIDPATGAVVKRIPISGPAGGLEYDREAGVLIAQLFVGHPHLAVIDPRSGAVVDTRWSDESAMGLARVDGDLLCTWASGFDEHASSELRLLDRSTGHVLGRVALDRVHSAMAPLDPRVAGTAGFMALTRSSRDPGPVVVRRYAYRHGTVAW